MSNLTEKELAELVMQWAMMTMTVKSTGKDSDPTLAQKNRPVELPE
jgi:hypothetical protein